MLFVDGGTSPQWWIATIVVLFFFWQCMAIKYGRQLRETPWWILIAFSLHTAGMVIGVVWLIQCIFP